MLKSVTRMLTDELGRQVLPDGGHASRNPGALVELLLDLLPLRQAFAARNVPPPPALNNAIDRMMPMLRFFRHGDGNFALFNGMGPTRTDLVSTVLAYDDARGTPVANAPHSGYQRVQAGDALLIVDAGPPPPLPMSHEAHAGCLSFELSSKLPPHRGQLRPAGDEPRDLAPRRARDRRAFDRGVQRHLVVPLPHLGVARSPCSARRSCPARPTCRCRAQERDNGVIAAPVARRLCGALRRRASARAAALARRQAARRRGPVRAGAWREPAGPARRRTSRCASTCIRCVKANRHSDGHGVMLVLPNKEVWTFDAYEERVELEESVYLAGPDGPRRAVQIVIYGQARAVPRVHWTFVASGRAGTGAPRRARGAGIAAIMLWTSRSIIARVSVTIAVMH